MEAPPSAPERFHGDHSYASTSEHEQDEAVEDGES